MGWRDDIDQPGGDVRLSTSRLDEATGVVREAPDELLAEARAVDASITLDEYTLARVIASEHASGAPAELACIGDADLNRAAADRLSLLDHVTGRTGRYGRQRTPRPVATSRDPRVRHLRAARALLSGEARGVARGAVRYFDPRTQLAMWNKAERTYCHPLAILESWTFRAPLQPVSERSTDDKGRVLCGVGKRRSGGQQWVGTIEGVDAYELMLLRPATGLIEQQARYAEAKALIESRGKTVPPAPPTSSGGSLYPLAVATVLVVLLGAA